MTGQAIDLVLEQLDQGMSNLGVIRDTVEHLIYRCSQVAFRMGDVNMLRDYIASLFDSYAARDIDRTALAADLNGVFSAFSSGDPYAMDLIAV